MARPRCPLEVTADTRHPGSVLRALADDPVAGFAVARHPNTPQDVLQGAARGLGRWERRRLRRSESERVRNPAVAAARGPLRARVGGEPAARGLRASRLAQRGPRPPPTTRFGPGPQPRPTTPRSRTDDGRPVIEWCRPRRGTPRRRCSILERAAAESGGPGPVAGRDPHAPPEILTALTRNPKQWVRVAAAKAPRTPLPVLFELATGDETRAAQRGGQGPGASGVDRRRARNERRFDGAVGGWQEPLPVGGGGGPAGTGSGPPGAVVRCRSAGAAAVGPGGPGTGFGRGVRARTRRRRAPEVLVQLLTDLNLNVRAAAVRNPAAPPEMVDLLARVLVISPRFRCTARSNPSTSCGWRRQRPCRCGVRRRDTLTPLSLLAELARHPLVEVRLALAGIGGSLRRRSSPSSPLTPIRTCAKAATLAR